MRRSALLAAVAATALLASACSRLTFLRPDAGRGDSEQVAPTYELRGESRAERGRLAARRHVSAAEALLRQRDVDGAEGELRAALKQDGELPEAHTLLGVVEESRGRNAQAGVHYEQAALLAPRTGAMLNNYGAWLCANGRAAESLAWFDRALADPGYATRASALGNAGACAARAGQYGRVERDLRAALAQEPGNAVALAAMAEEQSRRGNHLEARAFVERRLAAAPATPEILGLAARIERSLGDNAAAARYVERLGREFPRSTNMQTGDSSKP